jgi:hypothetical protein
MANFTGQPISASYSRLLQIDGGAIQDGLGSTISNATIGSLTGSFSGSLRGTATSASFAVTASYALNAGAGVGFPFTGSARITGSLIVTGSTNISSALNVNGSLTANDVLTVNNSAEFNSVLTANSSAEFNDVVNVNFNPLTVNQSTYISARTNIVELIATATTHSVTNYPAGTTFFVNMTGSATASFSFGPANPSYIGTSYKILITKYTAGEIRLAAAPADFVLYGHYIDTSKPNSFSGARTVKITSPGATCIEAYFIDGNNNDEWFFDISTAGSLTAG